MCQIKGTKVKKLLIVTALCLCAVSAQAGWFDTTIGWGTTTTSIKYKLSVNGSDVRVYEWVPAHNRNMSCVFVAGKKSSGVACYPKGK